MNVSIVMTCYNRKVLLYRTLSSIERFYKTDKGVEIIIVDDASDTDQRIDFLDQFDMDIKLIENKAADKWWHNPCIPFNQGIKMATGEIVILQNAECIHYGNIIEHACNNLTANDYFSYGCYALNRQTTEQLSEDFLTFIEENVFFVPKAYVTEEGIERGGWYNHTQYRNTGWHFTSAIYRQELLDIGCFNEEFARGIAWEDMEFLYRMKAYGKNVQVVNSPFVIHQWHCSPERTVKWRAKWKLNKKRYRYAVRAIDQGVGSNV